MGLLRPDLFGTQIATSAVGGTVTDPRDYLTSIELSSDPANYDAGGSVEKPIDTSSAEPNIVTRVDDHEFSAEGEESGEDSRSSFRN